jgi:uncharacterized protein YqgQ
MTKYKHLFLRKTQDIITNYEFKDMHEIINLIPSYATDYNFVNTEESRLYYEDEGWLTQEDFLEIVKILETKKDVFITTKDLKVYTYKEVKNNPLFARD